MEGIGRDIAPVDVGQVLSGDVQTPGVVEETGRDDGSWGAELASLRFDGGGQILRFLLRRGFGGQVAQDDNEAAASPRADRENLGVRDDLDLELLGAAQATKGPERILQLSSSSGGVL